MVTNVIIMMAIAATASGGTINAVNNYNPDSGKVEFKKTKQYEPKKEKKKTTLFGYEIKPVKPAEFRKRR